MQQCRGTGVTMHQTIVSCVFIKVHLHKHMSIQYLFIHICIYIYTYLHLCCQHCFSWKFQGLPPWDRIVKDFEKYDCGAFVRSKTAGNHMLLALEATQVLEDEHDRVVFQCPVEVSSVGLPFFPLLVFPMGMLWHLKPNHPSISAMRLCMSKLPWRCVVNWGILHDMAFPPQIKSKPRMLDAGIPILHTNLELGPSASHHSQEFLSDNHTEALF